MFNINEEPKYYGKDGTEFKDREEAIAYDEKLKDVKVFTIRYNPDLNEGRGLQKAGIILVHARDNHKEFVEHWCYNNLGNRIAFVMDTYGSNTLTDNWIIKESIWRDTQEHEVLVRLEEDFVEKIWD